MSFSQVWNHPSLLLVVLVASFARAGVSRVVDALEPTVGGTTEAAYLHLTLSEMPAVPIGEEVRKAVLEFTMDLPAGTTLELWTWVGEGLPWDHEGGRLVDTWTLDERTGKQVLFRLPPALRAGATLWVRPDPGEENRTLTAKAVVKAERVVSLGRERRRTR